MTNATEALHAHRAHMRELTGQAQALRAKLDNAQDAELEASKAQQAVHVATAKRRSILGRAFMGEKLDSTDADAEMEAAREQASQVAATAEGAAAARELLQPELDALNQEIRTQAGQLPALELEVVREHTQAAIDAYRARVRDIVEAHAPAVAWCRELTARGGPGWVQGNAFEWQVPDFASGSPSGWLAHGWQDFGDKSEIAGVIQAEIAELLA